MRQADLQRMNHPKDFILNRHKFSVPPNGQIDSFRKNKMSSSKPLFNKDNIDNLRKQQFEQFLLKERKKQSLSELEQRGNKETSIKIKYFKTGTELNPDRPSFASFSFQEFGEPIQTKLLKQELFPAKYEKVTS